MLIIIPINIMLQLHLHNVYYLVPISKQVIWLCFTLIHCRSNYRASWSTTFPETDFYFVIHDQHHMGSTHWHWWRHKRLHCKMAGSKWNISLNAKSCSTFFFFFISFYLLLSYNPSFLIRLCFNMVSFRGQKMLGPRPDRSPLRV